MNILVTGAAGFIGSSLSKRLLGDGHHVVGIDDLNDYYDPQLKEDRLKRLDGAPNFLFEKMDIADPKKINQLFKSYQFNTVVHLAAQAGVRYSIENPNAYIKANIVGFANVMEACRKHHIQNFVYASSSSVYGMNTKQPFSEHDNVDHPVSLYAATKKSNEIMAHSYAHLYGLPCTGLRFFTVYGPWGRPDMALFKFTKNILAEKPIDVYNQGNMIRDFTYIDDIVEGLRRVVDHRAEGAPEFSTQKPDPAISNAPYRIYNIGNNNPVKLIDFIGAIEKATGKEAIKNFLPLQEGDVVATYADVNLLVHDFHYQPKMPIEKGVANFVNWFQEYYGNSLPRTISNQ